MLAADVAGRGKREEVTHAQLGADRIDQRGELAAHDDRVHPCVVDDEGELRPGQAEVQRDKNRAQLAAGEEHLEELGHIDRENCHPVAVTDTEVGKRRRTAVHLLVQLAIRPRSTLEHKRGARRRELCPPRQPEADPVVSCHAFILAKAASYPHVEAESVVEQREVLDSCAAFLSDNARTSRHARRCW